MPPNLLLVVTTQWRAADAPFGSQPLPRTPALDKLAHTSTVYTQAVTPHPFGPFARAAMLTGRSSPANGVVDYFDPLPPNASTVAHRLRDLGYLAGFFGKWHLSPRDRHASLVGEAHARQDVPVEYRGGFDFWEGFESGFLLNDPWLQGGAVGAPRRFPGYQSDVVVDRALRWIAETPSRPWFTLVSLEAPHPPYDAPSDLSGSVKPDEIMLRPNVPRGGDIEVKARRELAGYYQHIEATDRALGRLFEGLGSRGETTLIVFTSVHGDMHGAHGLFRKGWPHEEAIRVPLVVHRPGQRTAEQSDAEVSLLELQDLLVSEAGATQWSPAGGPKEISMPSRVELPWQCDRAWRGVRSIRRKYIQDETGADWLLFDLEKDPFELTNLVGRPDYAAELAEFRQHMKAMPSR